MYITRGKGGLVEDKSPNLETWRNQSFNKLRFWQNISHIIKKKQYLPSTSSGLLKSATLLQLKPPTLNPTNHQKNTAETLAAIMATTSGQESSFDILGSAKLNTPDGKNPASVPSSATTSTQGQTAGANDQASAVGDDNDRKTACQKAHDQLEARLRDEELNARSRGW